MRGRVLYVRVGLGVRPGPYRMGGAIPYPYRVCFLVFAVTPREGSAGFHTVESVSGPRTRPMPPKLYHYGNRRTKPNYANENANANKISKDT